MTCTISEEEKNKTNRENNRYSKYSRLLNSLGIILNTLGSTVILAYTLATYHHKPKNDSMYQQILLEVSVILIVIGCLLALGSIVVSGKVKIDITQPSTQPSDGKITRSKSFYSCLSRKKGAASNVAIHSSDGVPTISKRHTVPCLLFGGHRNSVDTNHTTTFDGRRKSMGTNYTTAASSVVT